MTRQYFKSKEKNKKENKSRTRRQQALDKIEKQKFLDSPEGKAAVNKISLIDKISEALAAKI